MTYSNRILGSILAAVVWQSSALAGLGADTHSIAVDRVALRGAPQSISTQPQYDQHTITTDSGTTVNEYATREGTVFAVTWRGPAPPDLQLLFGAYYEQYQGAAAATANTHPGDHHHLKVVNDDLVVQSVSRARFYHGRAYVRSLMPAGISINDLP